MRTLPVGYVPLVRRLSASLLKIISDAQSFMPGGLCVRTGLLRRHLAGAHGLIEWGTLNFLTQVRRFVLDESRKRGCPMQARIWLEWRFRSSHAVYKARTLPCKRTFQRPLKKV